MKFTRYGFFEEFGAKDFDVLVLVLGNLHRLLMQFRVKLTPKILTAEAHAGLPLSHFVVGVSLGVEDHLLVDGAAEVLGDLLGVAGQAPFAALDPVIAGLVYADRFGHDGLGDTAGAAQFLEGGFQFLGHAVPPEFQ